MIRDKTVKRARGSMSGVLNQQFMEQCGAGPPVAEDENRRLNPGLPDPLAMDGFITPAQPGVNHCRVQTNRRDVGLSRADGKAAPG